MSDIIEPPEAPAVSTGEVAVPVPPPCVPWLPASFTVEDAPLDVSLVHALTKRAKATVVSTVFIFITIFYKKLFPAICSNLSSEGRSL
jgi:hypothetical protein